MTITSTAFQEGENIPAEYTGDGDNLSPPLTFSEIVDGAESLALIVEDPDAPGGIFTHWMLYNMSPATLQILEHGLPETGQEGLNSAGLVGYFGPKPPAGPAHRYQFRLYALDTMLPLDQGASREALEGVLAGHVIGTAELTGLYATS